MVLLDKQSTARNGETRPTAWYRHQAFGFMHKIRIDVRSWNFEEALTNALNEVVNTAVRLDLANDSSIAIPLRARETEPLALATAMLMNLLDELNDGVRVGSVQIDGLLKRDGDLVCWGYAFAASAQGRGEPAPMQLRDVQIEETIGAVAIAFTLEVGSPKEREVHRGGVESPP